MPLVVGQPAALPMPVVVAGPPQTAEPGGDNIWRGRWSDGLCGCFSDLPSCLLGTLGTVCLPILGCLKAWPLAQVKVLSSRVGVFLFVMVFGCLGVAAIFFPIWMITHPISSSSYAYRSPDGSSWGYGYRAELNFVWLLPMLAIIILLAVLSLVYRTKLRRHYDIEAGDGCADATADALLVLFCLPCSICQEYRHVLRACGFKKDIFPRVMAPVQYHNGMAYVWARPQQQTETQV
ncbi:unnamed protein product [Vitrella brassicaformis CCMP3155]|uniref:Uncharacterized protein n=2 Tax=Vitrella brassicaformis TaxID=1169539 RepID=A0A0G4GF71_VITBC|nr:unnamed protein product [Vitrella brassicaformis CCMP3155]|eukprot:CEM28142.1 unnamed protein product [Vitrella brassicaformis CCMP3155]